MPLTIDDTKINELKLAPNLPDVVQELQLFLADEQQRREAFLNNLDDNVKAEFIEGKIVLNSPAKRKHYLAVGNLFKLLNIFVEVHNLGEVATEKVLIHLTRNDFEPDIVFFSNEKVQNFDANTMLHPAPDFVVEVLSSSTERTDRGVKFEDYANHHIKEYWIIDPDTEMVEQYLLQKSRKYELHLKSGTGEISATMVSGFSIPVRAIFDKETNMQVLKSLL
ncbi:MAG: Uma2 family endonuclease [Niabella sp.]